MSLGLRIDGPSKKHPDGALRVSGRLVGQWVEKFEQTCLHLLQEADVVVVDIRELTFVDDAGIDAVARLSQQGIEFIGGSGFIRQRLGLKPA